MQSRDQLHPTVIDETGDSEEGIETVDEVPIARILISLTVNKHHC